jgi:peptide/nickel transport system permease protein
VTAYLTRRLLSGAFLVVLLTFLTYAVYFTIPVDPAIVILTGQGVERPTAEQVAFVREQYGLDRPMVVQWADFLWDAVRELDFGRAFFGDIAVGDALLEAVPITAALAGGGALLLLLLAVPLAMVSAVRARTAVDRAILAVAVIGIAVHPFVLALGLREMFAAKLPLSPGGTYCPLRPGLEDECGGVLDWAHHLWLPWLTFALLFLPVYTRIVRGRLLETLGEPYIAAVRAKGASEVRVVRAHALRNAMLPVLPMLAMDAGTAVTAAIYIETIYGMPGLGRLAVTALSASGGYDLPIIVAVVFTVAVAVVLLSLLADLAIAALDPRIQATSSGTLPLPLALARLGAAIRRGVPADGRTALKAAIVAAAVLLLGAHVAREASEKVPAPELGANVQTLRLGWNEERPVDGGGRMTFQVRSIQLGSKGWRVRASFRNETPIELHVTKGLGFAIASSFGLVHTREPLPGLDSIPAIHSNPPLPARVAPGASWSGVFSGLGAPPAGATVYVSFGQFAAEDPNFTPFNRLAGCLQFRANRLRPC